MAGREVKRLLHFICNECFPVSEIEDAVMNDRVRPVLFRSFGYTGLTDKVKFLRGNIYQGEFATIRITEQFSVCSNGNPFTNLLTGIHILTCFPVDTPPLPVFITRAIDIA